MSKNETRDDPAKSHTTTDHGTIQAWAEARDGHPARVKDSADHESEGQSGGILRIDFGEPEEGLERISWEEFFAIFDENNLAFLYQEEIHEGGVSHFFKFVRGDDMPPEGAQGTSGKADTTTSPRDEEGSDTHDHGDHAHDDRKEDDHTDEDKEEVEETALDEHDREIIEDVDADARDEDTGEAQREGRGGDVEA